MPEVNGGISSQHQHTGARAGMGSSFQLRDGNGGAGLDEDGNAAAQLRMPSEARAEGANGGKVRETDAEQVEHIIEGLIPRDSDASLGGGVGGAVSSAETSGHVIESVLRTCVNEVDTSAQSRRPPLPQPIGADSFP